MVLDESMNLKWKESINEVGTLSANIKSIQEYINKYRGCNIKDALAETNLIDFIFENNDESRNPQKKYNALQHFCKFVYYELLNDESYEFPIPYSYVKEFEPIKKIPAKRKKYETGYIEKNEYIAEFFNDKYYNHLHNEIAEKTIKAMFCMGFCLGFGTQELIANNANSKYLKIDDISIGDDDHLQVKIGRIQEKECNVEDIIIDTLVFPENCEKYVVDYYNLRINGSKNNNAFFIQMWNGRELDYKTDIINAKPSGLQALANYMLKYICSNLNMNTISISDMQANKVYFQLMNSNGAALKEIIERNGYKPFVESAFKRYLETISSKEHVGFDFFCNTSSSDYQEKDVIGDEVTPETYMTLLEKRRRNREIVLKLKQLYENKCQVCGEVINVDGYMKYSEVHHIQPLGGQHNGPDSSHNMMVLCPNHHCMFDLGIIAINPTDCRTILHKDSSDPLNGKKIDIKHIISETSIRYHYENLYTNSVDRCNFELLSK